MLYGIKRVEKKFIKKNQRLIFRCLSNRSTAVIKTTFLFGLITFNNNLVDIFFSFPVLFYKN